MILAGILGFFVYLYATRALGNAYNGLFLLHVALFSTSLFAFIAVVAGPAARVGAAHLAVGALRRGLAIFLAASAAVTAMVWLLPLLAAAVRHETPEHLDTYATPVTEVLDLGVLVPTLVLTSFLVLRRAPLGYLLAVVLLVLLLFVAATIVVGTVFQVAEDVSFTTGEIVGPIVGFLVLGAVGAVLLVPAREPARVVLCDGRRRMRVLVGVASRHGATRRSPTRSASCCGRRPSKPSWSTSRMRSTASATTRSCGSRDSYP